MKTGLRFCFSALCVELRPFYCNKRILVPMSYITFLYRCVVIFGFQKKQKNQKKQRKYPQILNSLFFGGICFVLLGVQQMGFSLCKRQHNNNNNNNNNNGVPGGTGGSEKLNSTPRHDTLRGRRKGDPQHKCCGKKTGNNNNIGHLTMV